MGKNPSRYVIGRKYHCSWAKNRGYVWILTAFNIENNAAELMTPKTKKKIKTELSSLRNINKYLNAD